MGYIAELKEFVSRGNVIDLAVGVIIGAAFGKIISSLVDDIIMPPVGYLTGGVDFADKKIVLVAADTVAEVEEVAIRYGNFVNTIIQFLIVAICIFSLVKAMNALKVQEKVQEKVAAVSSPEVNLLTEIRDLLKNQQA